MITHADLQSIHAFEGLSPEIYEWMLKEGEEIILLKGEKIFERGTEATKMFAILEGKVVAMADPEGNGDLRPVFTIQKGDVSGMLPYSRMKSASGDGVVTEPARIYALHTDKFKEMEHLHPELVQRLVSVMTDRARLGARSEQHREKLMALGKLSAGLAHELNNPAAAIKRTADELKNRLTSFPQKIKQLVKDPPSPEQVQYLSDLMAQKSETGCTLELSLSEKSRLEADLEDWLEDHDVEDAYLLVETFMEMGVGEEDLEKIAEKFQGAQLNNMLGWVDATLTSKRLVTEIEDAAGRISELVQAIKAYTHMDRSPNMEPTDLREGIKSTLAMLGHKIRKKQIETQLDFPSDLPKVRGLVGELNQVWTNLIDNAIDALPDQGGVIAIKAEQSGKYVQVSITDNGSGIPEEIRTRIFDPFFTTKKQGEGTGLGLDLTRRLIANHQGDIWVESQPGRTSFVVCVPRGEWGNE